jgi:hypothetical protein
MLDKILNDESLMAAHPNLYSGLLDPKAQPLTPTPVTNQVQDVEIEMTKLNSKAINLIKKLSSIVTKLESQCHPQSRKRNQDNPYSDNPEGEKSAKRQRTTTTAMFSS